MALEDALVVSRLQFAFTVTCHYLFPMLTMGLALSIFILKGIYMRNHDELYNKPARFWAKIFAVTFVMGVVTGIHLEFQFGTNWAAFSRFSGDIIAQTLAMEGAFAFFLESAFVRLFLLGGATLVITHRLVRMEEMVRSWCSKEAGSPNAEPTKSWHRSAVNTTACSRSKGRFCWHVKVFSTHSKVTHNDRWSKDLSSRRRA